MSFQDLSSYQSNSPFVGIFIVRSVKIRFSAIFPKISILRYMLLHKLYINVAIRYNVHLVYRNSLYDLAGPKYKNQSDRKEPRKGCGRKRLHCIQFKNAMKSKCFEQSKEVITVEKSLLTRKANEFPFRLGLVCLGLNCLRQ